MPDFLPRREDLLLNWTRNFTQLVSADPETYGISPEWAADLLARQEAFADAFGRAAAPGTRTVVAVQAKRAAKAELLSLVRMLAGWIRAHRSLSDGQLAELGLRYRKQAVRHVLPPADGPRIWIAPLDLSQQRLEKSGPVSGGTILGGTGRGLEMSGGRTVTVGLGDATATVGKARPANASAALIFTHIGEEPPADPSAWTLLGMTTRTRFNVTLGPAAKPGTKVWVQAQWQNRRGEPSPVSTPVAARIAGM